MLETDRLILREMTRDDAEALLTVFADPETMQFYPSPFDLAKTDAWIEWNLQNYQQYGYGLWALTLKATGELIGDCGLVVQQVEDAEEIEIGYHVRRDLWGQGIATEAARTCRDYGFRKLNCERLVSLIHPANLASRRVAEKNEMVLIQEMVWREKPTCLYAIDKFSIATGSISSAGLNPNTRA
jgi:RimJ/RimL family protein N-acetyltransferase